MSQTLAVAARELRERWLFLAGGLACGFFPLVLPAFGVPVDGAIAAGVFGALALGGFAGLFAGASMLARDALDGRLGFLFARPLPWSAIWGGKWLAAIVLVAGTTLFTALPWMLVFPHKPGGSWREVLVDPQGATFFSVLLLLTIGFANFNATLFRSRSGWAAVDLGLLLVAIWLVRRWVAPLYYLQIFGPYPLARPWGMLLVLGPPALALVLASATQVVFGRTDLRRAHRAMSVTFWVVIFAVLVAAGLRLAWARAATPADLTQYVSGSHDPSGRWLFAEGLSRRGGGAAFLIDTDRDRYVPIGVARLREPHALGMTFAADGTSGVILLNGPEHSVVFSVDLSEDVPRFTTVELEKSPPPTFATRLASSASGTTVLLAHESGASLFELPSGRRVATGTVPPGWGPGAARVLGESIGRIWLVPVIGGPGASDEMRLMEIEIGREARVVSVPLAAPVDPVRAWPHVAQPDAAGRRFLTRDGGLRLRDGETGTLIATLIDDPTERSAQPFGGRSSKGLFLGDGRIVVGDTVGARAVLHVFDPNGVHLHDVVLDRVPAGLTVGPELTPGRVAVRFWPTVAGEETLVVDLADGRVLERLSGRHPLRGFWGLGGSWAHAGSTYFLAGEGNVVRHDSATGKERKVIGTGATPGERLTLE